ncbi:MAG TPA: glycoside hydrolase family 38 C-terminal domain-containing protein [Solirubrobacteraceae bacterium]|nr:glycoside hydrolase family 38 C-terminal domain-containing protein [Solirubrobacteraceae bacterium]
MIAHPEYTRARLEQVSQRLQARVYAGTRPVDEMLVSPRVDRISWEAAQRLEYRPVELGERFGPAFATYWLRVRATVPDSWSNARVDLRWRSGSEATVWCDGRVAAGLNQHHAEVTLADAARPGPLSCEVEIACNGLFGRPGTPVELTRCELAQFDPEAWRVACDFEVLRCLERHPATEPTWAAVLRRQLERFCDSRDPAILAALYDHHNATQAPGLTAVGHAHIDTAWLWPLAETYRKLQRTLGTALAYMDEYPEYRFAFSQAQHYAWIKERDRHLWERLRNKVAAGQVVPVGGSWVEPDLILPSGESLVRQLLLGQRFFERELGVRCEEFWAPDAFGYPGQLPQLIRGAGMTRFLTQKLSWNRFNRPEHHTFTWQGDDGSEVLAHFPPADTYSSPADVEGLLRSARDHPYADAAHTGLLLFGHGDGGGGPTRQMLESLRRASDLQGLPRTRMGTPSEFFADLEAQPAPRPVVVGELYFEFHRGTYTSQAFVKRANRRCEQGLHDAEFLGVARGDEDRRELERLWKLLAVQQFHDILPGSSIRDVYEDAERDFAALAAGIEALIGDGPTPVNTTGFARRQVERGRVMAAPPYGPAYEVEAEDEVRVDGLTLENAHLKVTLSPGGRVAQVLHKASGRESLEAPGNELVLYDDDPVQFDAWDIDPYTLATGRAAPAARSWEIVSGTPLRAEVAFERALGADSRVRQVVRLDAGSRRLEFHTTVDWHESHTLLKARFPLAVRARRATYETAFGYAERPTHYSTAQDRARYEVPGHRFADLSEHGFGVALLTDSKYGYSCYGADLRVSLLRAPKSPDPEADMGRHELAYALVPHAGGWREAGIVREAALFNAPLRWTRLDRAGSFAAVEAGELVLDTIKRAEDSDDVVLRLYEPHGGRGVARVRLAAPVRRARRANLLEDDGDTLSLDEDGAIVIPYAPHEIVTVKVS